MQMLNQLTDGKEGRPRTRGAPGVRSFIVQRRAGSAARHSLGFGVVPTQGTWVLALLKHAQ